MRKVVRFKCSSCVEIVPGDGVYLLSERGDQVRLQGVLTERLAPLLDGKRDRREVVSALAGSFSEGRVESTVDRLLAAGHLTEVDADADPRAGGFWELAGMSGDAALRALSGAVVSVVRLDGLPAEWFAQAAAGLGLSVGSGDPDLTVVLVDDYLHPRLAEHNQRSLTDGMPWLLAKPIGTTVWLGPVFEPGRTGCWQCLATRLTGNDMVRAYLHRAGGGSRPAVASVADLPLTRQIGAQLAALHAAKWLAASASADRRLDSSVAGGDVVTVDLLDMRVRRHVLTRRPQCAACGDPGLQAGAQLSPVRLVSRKKVATIDGGHRANEPEMLLAEHEPLISPITGVVTELRRVATGVKDLYAYQAGQNFAVPVSRIDQLRIGLRSHAAGKGMTELQAKTSAIAEAIERSSGVYRGDEARVTASFSQLGGDAIAPNELQLYSERQFAERDQWNKTDSPYQRVCEPFDPSETIEWTPVWSLSRQRRRYLPTAALFYGYPAPKDGSYAIADSNGSAAGTCLEDAILQGFFELVERDSVAIWWYNRLRQPAIDLRTFGDSYFERWQHRYASLGRETWALDLRTDLGIPTVAAVSRRIGGPTEDILLGFGAHFDVKVAIARAMTEMNQFLPAAAGVAVTNADAASRDQELQYWWRTATMANQPYLLPSDEPTRVAGDFTDLSSDDLAEDILAAQRIVERASLELLVLDQTRPDIGLPVVKVLVPGMRHFWARFAPGRLYDVPVRMGWLTKPTTEPELNPIAMFL